MGRKTQGSIRKRNLAVYVRWFFARLALVLLHGALHLAVKFAGERLYGRPAISHGALEGRRVFCSDMTLKAMKPEIP